MSSTENWLASRVYCIQPALAARRTGGRVRGDQPINPATPVNTNTLSQQVYANLRAGILDNTYPPGAALPEEALAAKLNVSRVPVREALRRLSAEGLVVIKPRQGATVIELTPKQFLDAYQVREALEVLAVRLAVPKLTTADLDQLDALHQAMQTASEADDPDAFFAANAEFHGFLVEKAENGDLKSIYDSLIDRMRRYRAPSLDLRGGMATSIDEHAAILSAVRAGNTDEAARLIAEHIHVPQSVLEEELERDEEPA
jgi:DNA-binding GntR family transcriptional regulator